MTNGFERIDPELTLSKIEVAALRNPEIRDALERARDPDPASLRRRPR